MPRRKGEAEICTATEHLAAAVRAKDLDGLMAHYAPDVRSFGLPGPLQYVGVDAVRKQAAAWLDSYESPLGYEIRELSITAGPDVAFSHSLNRVTGTMTDGTKVDMWWRSTVGYRKMDGRWLITHRHDSVPFDMESGKASVDLTP